MHGPAKAVRAKRQRPWPGKIFQDKRKTLHEIGAYTTLNLLNAFCGAALNSMAGVRRRSRTARILDLLGNNAPDPHWPLYKSFLRMIDFLPGMTDSYATEMAREMTGAPVRYKQ